MLLNVHKIGYKFKAILQLLMILYKFSFSFSNCSIFFSSLFLSNGDNGSTLIPTLSISSICLMLYLTPSKFGTLLLIQNEMMFLPYKPLSIQIGKFHLSFKLSRTLISWLKCYRNKQICKLNYDQILKSMKMIIYEDELKNIKSVTYTDDELYTPENIKSFINDGSIETENNAGNSSNLRLVDEDVEKRIEIIFKKIRTEKINQSKKKTSNTSIMANNTKNQLVIMDTEGGGGVTARELH